MRISDWSSDVCSSVLRLVTRAPVVVLVHHVHRVQWPVAVPGRLSRVGWWLESRLAPFVYRRDQSVAVSRATDRKSVVEGHSVSGRVTIGGCRFIKKNILYTP